MGTYKFDGNIQIQDGDVMLNFAPAYDATATYAVGDVCTYRGVLYQCSTAISTAEAWTAAHWTAISIASLINGAINGSY